MSTEPATGLIEYLRAAWEAGRPMPPFALFGRAATRDEMHATLKMMAAGTSDAVSQPTR